MANKIKLTDAVLLNSLRENRKNLETRLATTNAAIRVLESGVSLCGDSSNEALALCGVKPFTRRTRNQKKTEEELKKLSDSVLLVFLDEPNESWHNWEVILKVQKKHPGHAKFIKNLVANKLKNWSDNDIFIQKIDRGLYKLKS